MRLIYQNNFNGLPFDHNTFVAHNIMEKKLGSNNLLGSISISCVEDLTKDDFVVGSLDFVEGALRKLSVEVPIPNYYPKELNYLLERGIVETELQYVNDLQYPFFIKPACHKMFDAKVINSYNELHTLRNVPYFSSVLCSEVVNFECEYRVFICEGKIVGVKHYLGNPLSQLPSEGVINEAIKNYRSAPVAYAMDIGITESGINLLVEINDFYSLGYYGLNPEVYTNCLLKRWNELCQN